MHSPTRIPEVLDLIDEVWSMIPSTQLMNVLYQATRMSSGNWGISDNELITKLIALRDRLRAENEKTASLLKGADRAAVPREES